MKYVVRFLINCIILISCIAFLSACKNSSDYSGPTPEIERVHNEIVFHGSDWSDVCFKHKEHSDRFASDCFQCHNCSDVRDETNWNCRSCHSSLDAESLCAGEYNDEYHGCTFSQCMRCHKGQSLNAPKQDNCNACHIEGSKTDSAPADNPNRAPTANDISITGTLKAGAILTGNYTYLDAENDPEGESTFQWYRDNDLITGATAKTYTLTDADEGRMIHFAVIPMAGTGTSPGPAAQSQPSGPVTSASVNSAPTATVYSGIKVEGCLGNSSMDQYINSLGADDVDGVYQIADTIRYIADVDTNMPCNPKSCVNYEFINTGINGTYSDKVAYKHEKYYAEYASYYIAYYKAGMCRTEWWISDSACCRSRGGGAIANSSQVLNDDGYMPPLVDWGDSCGNGITLSLYGGPNNKPGITGIPSVGETLAGDYEYHDNDGDPEGQSTFRWLQSNTVNGTYESIPGATQKTYTLTAADLGKFFKFEVTPVASIGETQGNPATSTFAGIGPITTP